PPRWHANQTNELEVALLVVSGDLDGELPREVSAWEYGIRSGPRACLAERGEGAVVQVSVQAGVGDGARGDIEAVRLIVLRRDRPANSRWGKANPTFKRKNPRLASESEIDFLAAGRQGAVRPAPAGEGNHSDIRDGSLQRSLGTGCKNGDRADELEA